MFSLAGMTFLSPVLLAALVSIPVLWWLLRVMPPRPKTLKFPAFFLMHDLPTDLKTPSHTPWWLLLLRSLIFLCFILALAEPVLKLTAGVPGSGGSVLVAVDNGYAAASNWGDREAKLREYLSQVRRTKRTVIFLPTAADETDGKLHFFGPMEAGEAEQWADHLQPMPWPTDHSAATVLAREVIDKHKVTHAIFLSDGTTTSQPDGRLFMETMQGGGGLTVARDENVNTPYVLRKTAAKPGHLDFSLERLTEAGKPENLMIGAYDAENNILDTMKFDFPAGERTTDLQWDVLNEMRSKVTRVSLMRNPMASSVYLTDSQWQQHPVGIVADQTLKDKDSFLNEVYYLKRALENQGALEIAQVGDLLKKSLSAIIWPDSANLTASERVNLLKWVEAGGLLIRFAGPNLAANPDDPLLPVRLRYGQRALEGAMTWEKPVKLGSVIPEESPFAGMDIPPDVTVTRQVLAEATPDTFEKTWLQLDDGTPLLTGGNQGKGVIVLVHTSAGTDWSNYCLSGLYVETLKRMIALSTGISGYKAESMLMPFLVLDGFGKLQQPGARSIIAAIDPKTPFKPSPLSPPGLYGKEQQFQVMNLGDALPEMISLTGTPPQATVEPYTLSGEKSIKADLLKWALWLLLIDTIVTLWLRGAITAPVRTGAAAAVVALLLLGASPARAEDLTTSIDLASNIYLAYVETGDSATDQVSYNGLLGLMNVINQRTTIHIKGVRGVNPVYDQLQYYPFLYWPMSQFQPELPDTASRAVQAYMAQGGLILFDTRDQQFASPSGDIKGATIGTKKLRALTQSLRIPELKEVEQGNILTKTFYLLSEFPGAFAGGRVWTEKEPNTANDGVTSVLIGGNDWAAAWSQAGEDRVRFPVTPGGEQQREMAYRFGVNVAMLSLAGNYKNDQVHVPYILERLHKQ